MYSCVSSISHVHSLSIDTKRVKQFSQGWCACLDENPIEYTEACGWDGGDCEGVEELCEGTIEPSPTEEPPADDTEEAFSNPSGGATPKSFEGLVWAVLALANAIGI